MNYATYVPAAVRNHLSRLLPVLNGIIDAPRGQAPRVVVEYFEVQNRTGDFWERRIKSFADEHVAAVIEKYFLSIQELELHKECLLRIAQDERMHEAYGILTGQFSEDESWHKLVWAATVASLDFRRYRVELSTASALCRRIDEMSRNLASLLEQVHECNVKIPAFVSLSVLLGEPSDNQAGVYNRVQVALHELAEAARTTAKEIDDRRHDSKAEHAWAVGGVLYNSPQNALVMSALKTRQSNPKTDYLRAFGWGLTVKDPDALTPAVQKAMAVVATVVINDPDNVVTYDDVRAVFGKGKVRAKGKSRKESHASLPHSRKTGRSKGD